MQKYAHSEKRAGSNGRVSSHTYADACNIGRLKQRTVLKDSDVVAVFALFPGTALALLAPCGFIYLNRFTCIQQGSRGLTGGEIFIDYLHGDSFSRGRIITRVRRDRCKFISVFISKSMMQRFTR